MLNFAALIQNYKDFALLVVESIKNTRNMTRSGLRGGFHVSSVWQQD
jgi:hypothetical protein